LIHEARLSQKQLAEKFVQIRFMLQGYMREPRPSSTVIEDIERDYQSIVRVWERNSDLRGRRKNIINLNLVMATLILRNGGNEMYWAHLEDFPTVGPEKWAQLFAKLTQIARRIGWTCLPCATYEVQRRRPIEHCDTYALRGYLDGGDTLD
jgi:hypothetical protein